MTVVGSDETPAPGEDDPAAHPAGGGPRGKYLLLLSIAALGVVYGDIATSPLYALRECFHGAHPIAPVRANILGVLSLIFWALALVVSIKYLVFIMRADNRGEGGIMALTALVRRSGGPGAESREKSLLLLIGLFGAALLYGDGVITPAISVLSAVEGLQIATPVLHRFVVPVTIGILVGLFLLQKRGTAGVGFLFGPVMLLWVVALGGLGLSALVRAPEVLSAINPLYGFQFFVNNGWHGFLILGAVVLAVTGAEALYADMGHFGRRPIRLAWFALVLPALLLNYFGQGALLLQHGDEVIHPFFHLAPPGMLLPLVGLATAAAIIASQAIISGAFSLTRQAMQLGYCPRMNIRHTSARQIGQIYVPSINWILMAACIWLVFEFKSSSNLAAAYGIAVTGTMAITTLLFYFVARERWGWPRGVAFLVSGAFLTVDVAFLGANMVKVHNGGWFPLAVAAVVFTLMTTWKTGRRILAEKQQADSFPVELFLREIAQKKVLRVPGTAIFLSRNPRGIPPALLHNVKHNKVLHERVLLLTVDNKEVPYLAGQERVSAEALGSGFYRVTVRYGFMEDSHLPTTLQRLSEQGIELKPMETTYFLGRETLIATRNPGMAIWREHIFARMARNERTATSFFSLPPNRVVELGEQIEL